MGSKNSETRWTKKTLADMSALEFNDKIVELSIFICKICGKFLKLPIMLVPTIGNVCGGCLPDNTSSTHDESLEIVLGMLLVPCRYQNEGCIEKLPYSEKPSHELRCRYRNHYCPLKLHGGCIWEGGFTDLLQHCMDVHADSFIPATCNVVKRELDISKDNETINVFKIDSNVFILHIKCDIQNLKQYFAVYYITASEIPREYIHRIIQTGCDGVGSIKLGSSETMQDIEFKGDNALVVDLSLIKPFVNTNNMSVKIKIILQNEVEEIRTDILDSLECPVCNNYMRPPIFQCLTGHSLCNQCSAKRHTCPICSTGFAATRNFVLESISIRTKLPCINHHIGCHVVLKYAEIEKHEDECPLKSYNCPFNDSTPCNWTGTLNYIINHLKTNHNDKVVFANYSKVDVPFSIDRDYFSSYCMVIDKAVFRVCYKRDTLNQNSNWAAQLIGPRGRSKNYRTEIGLIDIRNEHRRLITVDVVQDLHSLDAMFTECIMIPSTIVALFNCHGVVTYYCKIVEVK